MKQDYNLNVNFEEIITHIIKNNYSYSLELIYEKNYTFLNQVDKNGNNLIHLLLMEGNSNLMGVIMKLYRKHYKYNSKPLIDLDHKNNNGETPLVIAIKNNQVNLFKLLALIGGNIHAQYKNQSLLDLAVTYNNKEIAQYLLTRGAFLLTNRISSTVN